MSLRKNAQLVLISIGIMCIKTPLLALDVSSQIETLGNPYQSDYPDGEDIYARNIWDLQVYQGKVYLGAGNSSNDGPAQNAGPVNIYSYNPVINQFSKEGEVDDEQIDLYRVLNGDLYIPGHDALERWSRGNFYRLGSDNQWDKIRNIPDAIHVYDMAYNNGKLYAALGARSGSEVAVSDDDGETWEKILLGRSRVYSFMSIAHQLFAIKSIRDKAYMQDNDYNNLYTMINPVSATATILADMVSIPSSSGNTILEPVEKTIDSINYFLLAINHVLSSDVSVSYTTRNGTAEASKDYIETSGVATIQAGEQHIAIPVPIKADDKPESDESFSLIISNPLGANFPGGVTEIHSEHLISGNQVEIASAVTPDELFPDFNFDNNKVGKILRPVSSSNGITLYIGAYTHNDHQYLPFGLFRVSEEGIKKVDLNASYQIWDLLIIDNKVNVLVSELLSNNTYQIRVITSGIDDLILWEEIFNFNQTTFARSFEYIDGDYYFGLGTEIDDPDNWSQKELSTYTGEILRLSQTDYVK